MILNLLAENGKMYGYQIAQQVKALSDNKILIKEGSLYPALHKMQKEGLVHVETVNIGRRVRRYYSLTGKGIQVKKEQITEIEDFFATIKRIISPEINMQFS